jgi:hypothetical protein
MGLEDEVDNIIAAEAAAKEAVARRQQEIADYYNEPQDESNWLLSVTDELKVLLEEFSTFMLDWPVKPLPLVTAKSRGRKDFFASDEEVTTLTPVGYGGWQLPVIGRYRTSQDTESFAVTEKSELVLARFATRADLKASTDFFQYRHRYLPGLEHSNRDYKRVPIVPDFRLIKGIHEMLVLNPGEKHRSIAGPAAGCTPQHMPPQQGPLTPDSVLFHRTYSGEDYEYSKTVTVKQALVQEMLERKKHPRLSFATYLDKKNKAEGKRKKEWFGK